ncbi:unnamed protein product [Blepharisma stoltei]|uniref:non-specific serine/threonine protein kinase n=1 Tax=Blepharisma stoltei TaxID=1481888 RepID=A0AAU9JVF9_9CILI|nr:unnamed protein product [Blepharisma stoltei]
MGVNVSKRQFSTMLDFSSLDIPMTIKNIPIRSVYNFGKVIGTGRFGIVREAQAKGSKIKVAIKSISKSLLHGMDNALKREIEILAKLDHPNIIRFYEAYEDDQYINIVMENCCGGDLFKKIINAGNFDEDQTRIILKQILLAVNYLHDNKIVHRDLKPANFLFCKSEEGAMLKLADFGLSSRFTRRSDTFRIAVGTTHYMAPEVINGCYTFKCDIWSIGVIMYAMLSGNFPFHSKFECEIYKQIEKGDINIEDKIWESISAEAKDLLKKLLCVNHFQRLSASEALAHPWFSPLNKQPVHMDQSTLKAFQEYSKISNFQKEALSILVKLLSVDEIMELNSMFLDLEVNGFITMKTLNKALKNSGYQLARKEIKELMKSIAIDKNGKINHSEFLAAVVASKHHLQHEEIWLTFQHIDAEKKGYITSNDIKIAFERSGHKMNDKHLHKIMSEIGKNIQSQISLGEFVEVFQKIHM